MRSSKAAAAAFVLALAPIGAASAAPAPSAPSPSAQSTPDVAALAGNLANQDIVWEGCDFGSESLNERFSDAECATIQVPRDWHNPQDGNTFDIRISRVITVDPASPDYEGTITANPGGPGGEGLVWGPGIASFLPELHGTHNFLGFDPRGVGQSSHAVCNLPADEVQAAEDDETVGRLLASCQDNPDVRAINTEQTVYDMDFIRYLNGVDKLSYVGYSYGTWLGSWYGAVFGENAEALVLDSSTGLMDTTLENTFDIQAYGRDRQFDEHMMNWIARHNDTYELGTVPSEVRARYAEAQEVLGDSTTALVWDLTGGTSAFPVNEQYPLAAGSVKTVIRLAESAQAEAAAGDEQAAALPELNRADAAAWLEEHLKDLAQEPAHAELATKALDALTEENRTFETLSQAAAEEATFPVDMPFYWIMCQDGQFGTDLAAEQARAAASAADNPLSRSWGLTGVSPCTFFETDLSKPAADASFPKTIVIQSELDSQTAWELGYESGTSLPNTAFIAVDNEGSHGLFPYGFETVDQPVLNLLSEGTLPKKTIVAQGKPLPDDSTTYESWKRLNPNAKHVGVDRDDAFQPIKEKGNGHPRLPKDGLTPAELLQQTDANDANVDAQRELQRIADVGR